MKRLFQTCELLHTMQLTMTCLIAVALAKFNYLGYDVSFTKVVNAKQNLEGANKC